MPWQMAPPLIVIGLMFSLTGLGMETVDKVALGRPRRVRISNFEWALDRRDDHIRKLKIADAEARGDKDTVKALKKQPITAYLD